MTTDYQLTIRAPGQQPAVRAVTADSAGLAQAVHRHARGLLGSGRVDIHLDEETLTGTITSHGITTGEFTLQPQTPATETGPADNGSIRYGWTLRTLDALARAVVSNGRTWWPAGDREDLYAAAWHGIVERLYTADTEPRRNELMEAGRQAVADTVRDTMRHHGARRDSTNNGAHYAMYWQWAGRPAPSPEAGVVERLALDQILATLTRRQRQALDTLAATGDYAEAARLLDIEDQTFRSLLGRSRGAFRALWHEGETPSRPWGCDRRAGKTRGTVGEGSAVARIRRRARDRQAVA